MLSAIVAVLSAEPDVLWTAVTSGGVYCSAEMGDLDGDSVPDVACGLYYFDSEPTLWAVSGADGGTIWTSSEHNGIYQNEGFTWFPDVNNDGKREILMATPGGYAAPGRCLYLISGADGTTIWEWASCAVMPSYTGWGYSCCSGDDVSGDGVDECLGGFGTSGSSNTGLVVCINGASGDSIWTQWIPDAAEDLNRFIDADDDGIDDILLAVGGNHYTGETARLLSGADGSVLWQRDPGGDCMSIGVLERPDTWPLAVFCTFDGTVACFDAGGTLQWNYTGSGMYLDVRGGPDVNGDGWGDAALAADNGGTLCLSGLDGSVLWSVNSGSNTWSVAWVDPVLIEGIPVPCVAAGSVNGRKAMLINALSGEVVWETEFSERVYNVTAVPLGLPSPVVIAGLQDQQSLPYHAWALASSVESGVETSPFSGSLFQAVNPSSGTIFFSVAAPGDVFLECYDISGRRIFGGTYRGDGTRHTSQEIRPGVYLIRIITAEEEEVHRITVL